MSADTPIPLDSVKAFLQAMVDCRTLNKMKMPGGWKYSCIEDFILKNGRSFKPMPLPKKVKRGKMKQCFKNAADLALDSSLTPGHIELVYVEGYALNIIPVHHAWCVDREGNVYDNTWPDGGKEYYGVMFTTSFLADRLLKSKTYGLIDQWELDWPLLRGMKGWEVKI